MFVFQRVSSRRVWRDRKLTDGSLESTPYIATKAEGAISELVQKVVGEVKVFRLDANVYMNSLLGIEDGRGESPEPNILDALQNLFERVSEKHLSYISKHRYFPTALVGHVLHTVRDCRSQDFTPVYITARDVRTGVASAHRDEQFTIWLPNPEHIKTDAADIWGDANDTDAAALVSRYISALMIGIAVSYAPRELLLDFLSDEADKKWRPLIEEAFRLNGGPLMTVFVEQVRSRRAISPLLGKMDPFLIRLSDEDRRTWARDAPEPLDVLGVDIGGTVIKARKFSVRPRSDTQVPDFDGRELIEITWDDAKPTQCDASPSERARSLLDEVGSRSGAKNVRALGISLAAPVMDEVPVGVSTVSAKLLNGGAPEIAKCNAQDLHKIDFTRAATEVFGECVTTSVLNDGEADIRASGSALRGIREGVSLVLKEGTGVAFALYVNGEPVDVIAETAKAVLNLRCKPQNEKEPEERFQQGMLSERCSKKKFGTLLYLLGPDEAWCRLLGDRQDDFASLLIGGLLQMSVAPDGSHEKRPAEIADLWRRQAQTSVTSVGGRVYKELELKHPDKGTEYCVEILEALTRTMPKLISVKPSDLYQRALAGRETRAHRGVVSLIRKYEDLGDPTKAAVCCAWVLGRWLADAIALAWELFKAREVRLAGGPLSGETGLFVTISARNALEEVYGFDLEPAEEGSVADEQLLGGPERIFRHGPREIKRLMLVPPPQSHAEGGPSGAAHAAFNAYLTDLKLKQLLACRSWAADRDARVDDPFSSKSVEDAVRASAPKPWLLSDVEVADMLSRESWALALTRTADGEFVSYGRPRKIAPPTTRLATTPASPPRGRHPCQRRRRIMSPIYPGPHNQSPHQPSFLTDVDQSFNMKLCCFAELDKLSRSDRIHYFLRGNPQLRQYCGSGSRHWAQTGGALTLGGI